MYPIEVYKDMLKAVLDDDYGINEKGWKEVKRFTNVYFNGVPPTEITDLLNRVEATANRFYLPK